MGLGQESIALQVLLFFSVLSFLPSITRQASRVYLQAPYSWSNGHGRGRQKHLSLEAAACSELTRITIYMVLKSLAGYLQYMYSTCTCCHVITLPYPIL